MRLTAGSLRRLSIDSNPSASSWPSRLPPAQPTTSCSWRSAHSALPDTNGTASAAASCRPCSRRLPEMAQSVIQRDLGSCIQQCGTPPRPHACSNACQRAQFSAASQSVGMSDKPSPSCRKSGCMDMERHGHCPVQHCSHRSERRDMMSFPWTNQISSTPTAFCEIYGGELSLNRIKARS